ncbi:MAG: DUF3052 domain-containing protein [Candidatus Solibacter sp.]
MGQEVECRMQHGGRTLAGKAYLEGDHVLFRGEGRLKIWTKDLQSVRAEDGVLVLEFPGGPASFEMGAVAEKWARKILNPPSRASKLGIKSGLTVRVAGTFAADFLAELGELKTVRGKADLVFVAVADRAGLAQVTKCAAWLMPEGALWVVYPKGVAAIRETEVITAGRAAGLKDVKISSFSTTQTALKFVIPVGQRA